MDQLRNTHASQLDAALRDIQSGDGLYSDGLDDELIGGKEWLA